jgi:hypothetical protein
MPKIFVEIAAYRDPELWPTLEDALNKASRPHELSFGVIWQGKFGVDALPLEKIKNCKVLAVDSQISQGVGWARAKGQQIWDGEPFMLQIDSHMRFVTAWDDLLLLMLHQCDSRKPLLTAYPPPYIPGTPIREAEPMDLIASHFTEAGILGIKAGHSLKGELKPKRGAFIAAGFIFARSTLIQEVPYNPKIYFQGEEIDLTLRAWTNGWDIFHPNHVALYHYYGRQDCPKHWAEHPNWGALEKESVEQVRALWEQGKGLGSDRTLEEYQQFAGVNLEQRTIKL